MFPVVPAPARVTAGEGAFTLRAGDGVACSDAVLASVAATFVADLAAVGSLRLDVDAAPAARGAITLALVDQIDEVSELAPAYGVSPVDAEPGSERYRLLVTADGITAEGVSQEAVFRALISLRQLIEAASSGADEVELAAVEIIDAPRYAWRGLSLDVVRTFFSVAEVKRVIDQVARFKCNVLHLHLTDHEGWRLHIDSWPNLTAIGATGASGDRPGGFYTQDDYRELVSYAADRFVTIVPEIDLPGHCAAVFAAYPELGAADAPSDDSAMIPIVSMDPDLPTTMGFVRDVLSEVAALTPGAYLHLGADEAFGMDHAKYVKFVGGVREIIAGLGKLAVGWQESARAGLGADDVVQHWMDGGISLDKLSELGIDLPQELLSAIDETLALAGGDVPAALAAGARVLMSPLTVAYLDQPYGEPGAEDQEAQRARVGLPIYVGTTIRSAVEWDPLTMVDELTSEDQVAGVEGVVWCETVTSFEDLQFLIQPRLAGIAERGWARPGPFDWPDYSERLAAQAPAWRAQGWDYFRAASVDWQ